MKALVIVVMLAGVARADSVDDLLARGDELAKAREYSKAIVAFKKADAKRPSAAAACRIGLAYTRRELWSQAELFLTRCRERATPQDPAPDWIGDAEAALAEKVASAKIAAITIVVTPPDALIAISTFAPDEQFAPRTIHLAAGAHSLEVTAPGFDKVTREVTVDSDAQTIEITLARRGPRPGPTRAPWLLIGPGLVLGGIALGYDIFAVRPARNDLAGAKNQEDYDARRDTYGRRRTIDIALTLGAISLTGIGLWWRRHDSGPRFTAHVGTNGAAFAIGWSR